MTFSDKKLKLLYTVYDNQYELFQLLFIIHAGDEILYIHIHKYFFLLTAHWISKTIKDFLTFRGSVN
jgi:hypothetical protein